MAVDSMASRILWAWIVAGACVAAGIGCATPTSQPPTADIASGRASTYSLTAQQVVESTRMRQAAAPYASPETIAENARWCVKAMGAPGGAQYTYSINGATGCGVSHDKPEPGTYDPMGIRYNGSVLYPDGTPVNPSDDGTSLEKYLELHWRIADLILDGIDSDGRYHHSQLLDCAEFMKQAYLNDGLHMVVRRTDPQLGDYGWGSYDDCVELADAEDERVAAIRNSRD